MFKLILKSVGPNRLQLISRVATVLGIERKNARVLVDTADSCIGYGDDYQISLLLNMYEGLGAEVEYTFWPEGMDTASWARNMTFDGTTCKNCGTKLFFNVPGRTTAQEIQAIEDTYGKAFAHAGVYCPKCYHAVTVNFGDPRWLQQYPPNVK